MDYRLEDKKEELIYELLPNIREELIELLKDQYKEADIAKADLVTREFMDKVALICEEWSEEFEEVCFEVYSRKNKAAEQSFVDAFNCFNNASDRAEHSYKQQHTTEEDDENLLPEFKELKELKKRAHINPLS